MNVVGNIHTYFVDFAMKNFENDSESDFISEKAGIDGDCSVKNIVYSFPKCSWIF